MLGKVASSLRGFADTIDGGGNMSGFDQCRRLFKDISNNFEELWEKLKKNEIKEAWKKYWPEILMAAGAVLFIAGCFIPGVALLALLLPSVSLFAAALIVRARERNIIQLS